MDTVNKCGVKIFLNQIYANKQKGKKKVHKTI